MNWNMETYYISDDESLMDMNYVISSLHTTYWAEDRPDDIIRKSFENSTVLSLYEGDIPLGFARLVGDGSTFCWVCDVFVDPSVRGRGLSHFLLKCLTEHPMAQVRLKMLMTKDAHGLYAQYGFVRTEAMVLRETHY